MRNGPLDVRLRIDRGAAIVATGLTGGKMVDFMPWPQAPKLHEREEHMPEASTEAIMALFGGVKTESMEGTMSRSGRKWHRKA